MAERYLAHIFEMKSFIFEKIPINNTINSCCKLVSSLYWKILIIKLVFCAVFLFQKLQFKTIIVNKICWRNLLCYHLVRSSSIIFPFLFYLLITLSILNTKQHITKLALYLSTIFSTPIIILIQFFLNPTIAYIFMFLIIRSFSKIKPICIIFQVLNISQPYYSCLSFYLILSLSIVYITFSIQFITVKHD